MACDTGAADVASSSASVAAASVAADAGGSVDGRVVVAGCVLPKPPRAVAVRHSRSDFTAVRAPVAVAAATHRISRVTQQHDLSPSRSPRKLRRRRA